MENVKLLLQDHSFYRMDATLGNSNVVLLNLYQVNNSWYIDISILIRADPSGRSVVGIVGSNLAGVMDVCLL